MTFMNIGAIFVPLQKRIMTKRFFVLSFFMGFCNKWSNWFNNCNHFFQRLFDFRSKISHLLMRYRHTLKVKEGGDVEWVPFKDTPYNRNIMWIVFPFPIICKLHHTKSSYFFGSFKVWYLNINWIIYVSHLLRGGFVFSFDNFSYCKKDCLTKESVVKAAWQKFHFYCFLFLSFLLLQLLFHHLRAIFC